MSFQEMLDDRTKYHLIVKFLSKYEIESEINLNLLWSRINLRALNRFDHHFDKNTYFSPFTKKVSNEEKIQLRLRPDQREFGTISPVTTIIALTNSVITLYFNMSWKPHKRIGLLPGDLLFIDEDLWLNCEGTILSLYVVKYL